jgi:prolyl-tRNA synthetase
VIARWKEILGLVAALAAVVGIIMAADSKYAKATDVKAVEASAQQSVKQVAAYTQSVERRLNQKILQDKGDGLQDRIWKVEDRIQALRDGSREVPRALVEELRALQRDREKVLLDMKAATAGTVVP